LVDIDIQSEISPEDEALTEPAGEQERDTGQQIQDQQQAEETSTPQKLPERVEDIASGQPTSRSSGKHASLATPAVRHLTKQHNIDILDISGTGKEGRVLKEDVQNHISRQSSGPVITAPPSEPSGEDKLTPLSPVQRKMYQTMTKSLSIPHFLYSDMVDFTSLTTVRRALNLHPTPSKMAEERPPKLSALPFIIKAVSLSLNAFPSLNAHLDTTGEKPQFTHRASHNIGFAVDTPNGLLVPVIRSVQSHSISSLAAEINRLSALARTNSLVASDFRDATFTVSNIGSIGGLTVAPVIVSPQVAILGVGKSRVVPAFAEDGSVVRREECVFSWSADHRVVDGATVARCAELVKNYLEGVEKMMVMMK
jgi:2-oxoisovalerate dehydrogenase E2 component (dihydrolipoyl transacylase)